MIPKRPRREATSRAEGDGRVITRGDREYLLARAAKGGGITIRCNTCSATKDADEATLPAFLDAHDHPELRPPPPPPRTDLEQLIAKVRTLAELKGDGDELEVLEVLVDRLTSGLKVYGKLHVDSDQRDFAQEAFEEAADGMIYAAAGIVRRRRAARGGQ